MPTFLDISDGFTKSLIGTSHLQSSLLCVDFENRNIFLKYIVDTRWLAYYDINWHYCNTYSFIILKLTKAQNNHTGGGEGMIWQQP